VKMSIIILPVIVAALAGCSSAGGGGVPMGSGERWTPTCSGYYSGTNMPGACAGYRWR